MGLKNVRDEIQEERNKQQEDGQGNGNVPRMPQSMSSSMSSVRSMASHYGVSLPSMPSMPSGIHL